MEWMKKLFKRVLGSGSKGLIGVLLFFGLIPGLSNQSFGQASQNVNLVGNLAGGLPKDVFVSGNYAYVAAVRLLSIVDISDPSNPYQVGYYDAPVDISDPSNPYQVGYYDTPGSARGVYVLGNYAYVVDGGSGLRIIDISNPSSPTEVGYYDTPGHAYGVYVFGNYAYVADYGSGLWILKYTGGSKDEYLGSISVSPLSHNFESVNVAESSAAQTFTITNTGDTDLVLGRIIITGEGIVTCQAIGCPEINPGAFSIQSDNCSETTLGPQSTCTVEIVFSPTSTGPKIANLSIPPMIPIRRSWRYL